MMRAAALLLMAAAVASAQPLNGGGGAGYPGCTADGSNGLSCSGNVQGANVVTTGATPGFDLPGGISMNWPSPVAGTYTILLSGIAATSDLSDGASINLLSTNQTISGDKTNTGKVNSTGATHTLPAKVVANVGALPASGCAPGELAIVSAATLGQQIYENSGSGTCVWTQQTGGGGAFNQSFSSGTVAALAAGSTNFMGTTYASTEAKVHLPMAVSGTASAMYCLLSNAPGGVLTYTFTFRVNDADPSSQLTCTATGTATTTTCSGGPNSWTAGQPVDVKIVVPSGAATLWANCAVAYQ